MVAGRHDARLHQRRDQRHGRHPCHDLGGSPPAAARPIRRHRRIARLAVDPRAVQRPALRRRRRRGPGAHDVRATGEGLARIFALAGRALVGVRAPLGDRPSQVKGFDAEAVDFGGVLRVILTHRGNRGRQRDRQPKARRLPLPADGHGIMPAVQARDRTPAPGLVAANASLEPASAGSETSSERAGPVSSGACFARAKKASARLIAVRSRASSQAVISSAGAGTPACRPQRERRSCPRLCLPDGRAYSNQPPRAGRRAISGLSDRSPRCSGPAHAEVKGDPQGCLGRAGVRCCREQPPGTRERAIDSTRSSRPRENFRGPANPSNSVMAGEYARACLCSGR